eukprot:5886720-Amphidinium_carterae.2
MDQFKSQLKDTSSIEKQGQQRLVMSQGLLQQQRKRPLIVGGTSRLLTSTLMKDSSNESSSPKVAKVQTTRGTIIDRAAGARGSISRFPTYIHAC